MNQEQIAKLKELAQAAENEVIRSHGWAGSVEMLETLRIDEEYLTAASPAAILELIAMAEKQQIAEDAAKAIIAAIGDMPESERTTAPVSLTDERIEELAIKYESFGFGQAGEKSKLSIHGFEPEGLREFARALLAAAPAPIQQEPAAPVAWQPSEEQFESWRSRHGLHHSHSEAFYDAASLYLDATPPALAGSQVQAAGDARKRVARAIWNLRREDEDRCDMELEDMGDQHSVWAEADAAIAAMREQQT